MGKKAKEHRKKVAKRNEAIKSAKKKQDKAVQEYINQMIEKEKAAGKFSNNPALPNVGPTIGPSISLDGPTI